MELVLSISTKKNDPGKKALNPILLVTSDLESVHSHMFFDALENLEIGYRNFGYF